MSINVTCVGRALTASGRLTPRTEPQEEAADGGEDARLPGAADKTWVELRPCRRRAEAGASKPTSVEDVVESFTKAVRRDALGE